MGSDVPSTGRALGTPATSWEIRYILQFIPIRYMLYCSSFQLNHPFRIAVGSYWICFCVYLISYVPLSLPLQVLLCCLYSHSFFSHNLKRFCSAVLPPIVSFPWPLEVLLCYLSSFSFFSMTARCSAVLSFLPYRYRCCCVAFPPTVSLSWPPEALPWRFSSL